jgi:hypothetical protein
MNDNSVLFDWLTSQANPLEAHWDSFVAWISFELIVVDLTDHSLDSVGSARKQSQPDPGHGFNLA